MKHLIAILFLHLLSLVLPIHIFCVHLVIEEMRMRKSTPELIAILVKDLDNNRKAAYVLPFLDFEETPDLVKLLMFKKKMNYGDAIKVFPEVSIDKMRYGLFLFSPKFSEKLTQ